MDPYGGYGISTPENEFYNPSGSEKSTASSSSSYNPNAIVYSSSSIEGEDHDSGKNIYSLDHDGHFVSAAEQENSWSDLFVCGLKNIEDSDLTKEIAHWNEMYQQILDMEESEEKSKKLATIANDFVYCADTFGKIIISELYLPVDKKTIKPVDIGGVAGGLKFKIQDIMFKFVIDTEIREGVWMYGDDKRADGFAQKSANHEIKGLNHFMEISNCGLIRFPLMAIIDYRGYRLLAISQLPIDKTTIVYGSCDAGKTVHNSDPLINKEMERVAKILNLRGHTVGLTQTFVYGPGDIEVHKGYDGRYYMIDFARIFPPEYPLVFQNQKETIGREIFYQMLRPELVKKSKEPLSSDAFSGWQTSLFEEGLNRDVVVATKKLHTELINYALQVINAKPEIDFSPSTHKVYETCEIILILRSMGINYRYLGVIASQSKNKSIKELVLSDVVARVWKRIIRSKLRRIMDITRRPSEEPYKELIADVCEQLLKQDPDQVEFWSSMERGSFKYIALQVFPRCLSESDMNPKYDLRQSVDVKLIILRLSKMMNIKFYNSSFRQFLSLDDYILGIQDIEVVGSTVKYPYLIDFTQGSQLLKHTKEITKSQNSNPLEVERWVTNSKIVLHEAVRQMPAVYSVILNFIATFHVKASVTSDPLKATRLLIIAVTMHGWNVEPKLQNKASILGLVALCHLHLATIYLFHSNLYEDFQNELNTCRTQLEIALKEDPNCLDDYINHTIPMSSTLVASVLDKQQESYQKRKVHQLLTLVYLLVNTDKESIIHKPMDKYLNQIIQIDNFEILPHAEAFFNCKFLQKFFLHFRNRLRALSIRKTTITQMTTDTFSDLSQLVSLGISEIVFPDDPTFNSFFLNIFHNCKQLKNLTIISNKFISDVTFEGLHKYFQQLTCLELSKLPMVTDETLLKLAPHLSNLSSLTLTNTKEFTDNAVGVLLKTCRLLLKLNLDNLSSLTDKVGEYLVEYQTSLEKLVLTNCPGFTKETIDKIAINLTNLKHFDRPSFKQPHTYKICM
ncbi:hypothetical protein DLAC_03642 [Tieghemostelium lacteum]|uniref:Clu domain-containing protein n=1 Tax=Tieghemostelium lacteum TaxID=361077 RepID=A0A152A0C0_TIELA|nr:hypothetical protein DLAC_03642 [Tieghemostelium lacteum]|eukprot:KYQ99702.1 hypothetical protein DLAC_03642 [Tieghemostelium lacteum]